MNNIPEDSMLRRHYLTELKNRVEENEVVSAPFWSNQVLIPLVVFGFFMALVFI